MKFTTSIAVAALLGNVSAINVKRSEMFQDVDENMELEMDASLASKLKAQVSTRVSAVDPSCTAGINRFTNGTDNTWQTFKNAHSTSAKFQDAGFPADDTSLFWSSFIGSSSSDKQDMEHMKSRINSWKRPSEMTVYSGSPSLWGSKGKPVPNGVAQMSLGDCWFLSAASAIAEQPERIKRVIWNDSYDKNGAFRYFFWVKNKWHGVNIDDRLPMSGSYPYATQRSKDGAWWMPLMEKAYAKLDQNYERIIAGMGYEGLRTLTGMPTYYINNKKGAAKDESWTLLKALADKNFPMTTPCCNNIGQTYRLVSGHAYTLLNVLELSNGQKLARVRNPWNSERYNGPWSDKSDKWTAKFKQEAGYVDSNDGAFFMPFDLYVTEFWGASVALYQPYKGFHQENYMQSVRSQTFTVNNPAEQEFYVMAETYSDRNFPRTCNPENNSVLYMYGPDNKMVGTYGFIGWRGFGFAGLAGQKLPKGQYRVMVINQGYQKKAADLSVMFYFLDQKGTVTKA